VILGACSDVLPLRATINRKSRPQRTGGFPYLSTPTPKNLSVKAFKFHNFSRKR